MIKAKDIYDFIDTFAPFETQMSFDNAGLITGDENAVSDTVIVTLDVTAEVIQEAIEHNANIIVSHHPVIFYPTKSLASDSVPFLCARHNMTVISAHTNLDFSKGGVNDTLAELSGVIADEYSADGCTIIGHLEKPVSCRDFAKLLKENLHISGLRYTDTGMIQKIAVSCGAGGENISAAKKYGADGFITGEIKHHQIIYANDHDIAVFDLGHFNSENLIIPKLVKKLSEKFPDTNFIQSQTFSDKLIYLGE